MSTNKIALVTGGSRGLGRDMATSIARKGLDVVITYNSREDEASKVVQEIEALGRKAVALQLNTGDINQLDGFVNTFSQKLHDVFGADHFDFLVNNAGIGSYAPFAQVTEQQFDELMNIHVKGVFFLTQKLLPLLNDNGGIVTISSGLARFSAPGTITYATMKGAIEVFTRHLAKELGPRNIRVNTVAPGAIATDFGTAALKNNEQVQERIKSITAIPRVGLADDIGGVVAFLCTDDAKWITAQRIEASGGMNI
jgi:NAD(P)-dependent dehydrogenase (short-subunit alcohol dehydrogenase family)